MFPIGDMMENSSPFTEVYKKRRYKTGQFSLTEVGVQKLLENITNLEDLALIQLAIGTGIRREDIVRIKVKDIDFSNNSILFYEHKKKRTHKVYMPLSISNTLKMLINTRKGNVYLFCGRSEKRYKHGHLSGRSAYNIFNKYLKRAGLEPRPFHSLRATCIKLCQKRGWTIEQTAELVGDTIRVIQEHYATPSSEEMKQVSTEKAII